MEIIAHRGSSLIAPENTLAAVQLAWQEGADAVEGDFRLTADGHIVCMHDATLKRTAGVDRRVDECTLDELRSYDVGSWKGSQFAGQRIPTLEELLVTVPPGKRYFVEVKCGLEIIDELSRVTAACGLAPSQIVLICLDAQIIQQLKKSIPHSPVYWVVEFKHPSPQSFWKPDLDDMFATSKKCQADGLDLMATGPIDAALVNCIKSAGLALYAWTVDDPPLARQLIDLGVTGITTNRPGWLREQLQP